MPRRTTLAQLAAAPGTALAVVGLLHPHGLNADTASRWTTIHVAGLFVFPLVGLALAALMGRRRDPIAWIVRLSAFVYATAYTALDVISGIAAGYVTDRLGAGVPRPDEVWYLFAIGGRLGEVGSWALVVSTLAVTVDAVRRVGIVRAGPGALAVPGAWMVHVDHIFSPWGALGMLLIGIATGWLTWTVATPLP